MATLHLLGTGIPTPTPARFGTSYVLATGGAHLMFDCGPAATHKLVKAGLWPTQIGDLFFTHHHFDHNADYACFLLCRWDQSSGREQEPLSVWGPPPTQWITERLVGEEGAFRDDWRARVGAPVSQSTHANRGGVLPRPKPVYDVHDVGPGKVTEGEGWAVTAAPAHHVEPWLTSLAYRVDTPQGSIVFTGDTGRCETVDELACGADVLVVNCWDRQDAMEANGEAPGQTGTRDSAAMASAAGVKRLILTHTGPRLCGPGARERTVTEVAQGYDGEIIFGEELMSLPDLFA